MRAPTAWNFAGSFRKSLISPSSSMASSEPATSLNVTFGVSFDTSFARDLPNCMTRFPPPCMPDMMNQKKRPSSRIGTRKVATDSSQLGCGTSSSKCASLPAEYALLTAFDDLLAARCHVVELHLLPAALAEVGFSVRSTRWSVSTILAICTWPLLRSLRPSCVETCWKPEPVSKLEPTHTTMTAITI